MTVTSVRMNKFTLSIGDLFLARANLFEKIGAYEKAYLDLKQAEIRSRRDHQETHLRAGLELGNLGYMKGEYLASVKQFDRLESSIKKLGSPGLTFLFWRYRGNLFRVKGDYQTALGCYRKLLKFLSGKGAVEKKAITHNLIGLACQGMADYSSAARHIKLAYGHYCRIGNIPGQGNALGNIGLTYTFWDKPKEALSYFHKAISLMEQARVKNLIGSPLMNWGTALFKLGRHDEALQKWNEALELNQSLGDIGSVAMIHNNIGFLHLERNELEKSLEHLDLSLKIKLKLNLTGYLPSTYNALARANWKMYEKTGDRRYCVLAQTDVRQARSIANELHIMSQLKDADEFIEEMKNKK
jgi:tetratricopeptide (TPR) repeat protein